MHPHHDHLLVMRAVEDADAAALRQRDLVAPQKIVVELMRSRCLERRHVAALRVDAVHDMLDRGVLAGCVHCLKHNQHGPQVLSVELLLKLREPLAILLDDLLRLVLVEAAGRVGGMRLEAEGIGIIDLKRRDKVAQLQIT